MKFKKIVTSLLVTTLAITTLIACGNKKTTVEPTPTAEELMKNVLGDEEIVSGDVDVVIGIELDDSTDTEGFYTSMDSKLNAEMNIKFDSDTAHLDGNVDANIMGIALMQGVEAYVHNDGQGIALYSKDILSNEWLSFSTKNDDLMTLLNKVRLNASSYEYTNLKLENDGVSYIVTSSILAKDIIPLLDEKIENLSLEELLSKVSEKVDVDYEELSFNLTARFNKTTKELITIELEMNTDTFKIDTASFNKFYIGLTINEINGVNVEVPQEVFDNLTENNWYKELYDEFFGNTKVDEGQSSNSELNESDVTLSDNDSSTDIASLLEEYKLDIDTSEVATMFFDMGQSIFNLLLN